MAQQAPGRAPPGEGQGATQARDRAADAADLAVAVGRLTVNAATTLRERDRADDGFDQPATGTGRPTPLAAYGVFKNLREAGCATQVAEGGGTPASWHITPFGRRMEAFVKERWHDLTPRDPAAERRQRQDATRQRMARAKAMLARRPPGEPRT